MFSARNYDVVIVSVTNTRRRRAVSLVHRVASDFWRVADNDNYIANSTIIVFRLY